MQYELSIFRLLSFGPLFKIALVIAECAPCSLSIAELISMLIETLHVHISMHLIVICLGLSA